MKVLLVSSKYPPEYSGSGLRAHRTYRRLTDQYDIDVEVICSSVEFDEPARYEQDGIDVQRIVSGPLHRFQQIVDHRFTRRIADALRYQIEAAQTRSELRRRDFDVLHVYGQAPPTIASVLWSRRNDVPLMLELVNDRETPYIYPPSLGWATGYELQTQAVLVAISSGLADMCSDHGLDQNVWTRPNPVDIDTFSPSLERRDTKIHQRTPFDPDDRIVTYVANWVPRKNHPFLVDVLAELPQRFKLNLAGPVVSSGRNVERDRGIVEEVRNRARRYGIEDRLHVRTEFVDMASTLEATDVFCFPSVDEGLGTPVLEAICSGVPVVANRDEVAFREWIDDGVNGRLCPLEPDRWAKAVLEMASMEDDQRRKMAAELAGLVSADQIDAQYVELLKRLVETDPEESVDASRALPA